MSLATAKHVTATVGRAHLFTMIDRAAENGPVVIATKRHSAVLIDIDEWSSIEETLYLMSIPGVTEQIERSRHVPLSRCIRVKKG